MSASAPEGRPSRNTGSEEAVCTSAISVGEEVRVVITHAAATSFIHIVMLAASHTIQSMRKVGWASGAHGEVEWSVASFAGAGGVSRFSPVMDVRVCRDAKNG